MRVIKVTIDRHHEGLRAEIAMSPSALAEVVERFRDEPGPVLFNAADDDVLLELDLRELVELDPQEPHDELARVEFDHEPDDYEPITDDE